MSTVHIAFSVDCFTQQKHGLSLKDFWFTVTKFFGINQSMIDF